MSDSSSTIRKDQDREPRYRCVYPGLLRVLFPERSFVPISIAVRVVNLSSGGSLAVIHQGHLDAPLDALRGCYFELRIASSSAEPLYGRIARIDARTSAPVLGLRFHRSHPELIGQLIHGDTAEVDANTTLSLPVLDPYSPLSATTPIFLTGRSHDASEIVVGNDFGKSVTFPVVKGRFELSLELLCEGVNCFQLIARDGELRSLPHTVHVTYVPSAGDELFFRAEPTIDQNGRAVVDFEFLGTGQAGAALFVRMLDYLPESDRLRLQLRARAHDALNAGALGELRQIADELRELPSGSGG